MQQESTVSDGFISVSLRYTEALAVAAAFIHAGQDLMRGEPATLGIPAWVFAGGFFLYALLIRSVDDETSARILLTGGVPIGIGVFHLFASHQGGFFMPITYATILFGSVTLLQYIILKDTD